MSKIRIYDQFYTPIELAKQLIDLTYEVVGKNNITEIIEPSAGNGSFSNQIKDCIAYDIDPKNSSIKQQDFLQLNLSYKKGRLFIGNPPFGNSNKYLQFYNRCCLYGDYIAFILPPSQYKYSLRCYKFDLIYSELLGSVNYQGHIIRSQCFNIYKRPINGILNKKVSYKLKDVEIIDYRKYYTWDINKEKPNWDIAFCGWGDGTLGKRINKPHTYAREIYVYVKNKQYLKQIDVLLSRENLLKNFTGIASSFVSNNMLYIYLRNNIKNLK